MPVTLSGNTEPPRRERSLQPAMLRGARGRCPKCGTGRLFRAYLKVADNCPDCGEAMHHQRADDAPPYFTMLIVGHIVVAGLLAMEQAMAPPTWVQLAIWLPMTSGAVPRPTAGGKGRARRPAVGARYARLR